MPSMSLAVDKRPFTSGCDRGAVWRLLSAHQRAVGNETLALQEEQILGYLSPDAVKNLAAEFEDKPSAEGSIQMVSIDANLLVPNLTPCGTLEGELLRLFDEIRQFEVAAGMVQRFPWVLGLMQEAFEFVFAQFGRNVRMVLDVFSDPEGDGDESLFMLVRTSLPPDDALERIRAVRQALFAEAHNPIPDNFFIDVEFA